MPEWPRIRQVPARSAWDRLRGSRQWRPQLCRSEAPTADLRWPDRRQDQRPAAQVAPPPPSPLHRGRSLRWLPLRYLDPPSRILLDSSARSTGSRPLVLRERNPREPRVGVEWAFWDDWSVKLEYDYYGFGQTQRDVHRPNQRQLGSRGHQAGYSDRQARSEFPPL